MKVNYLVPVGKELHHVVIEGEPADIKECRWGKLTIREAIAPEVLTALRAKMEADRDSLIGEPITTEPKFTYRQEVAIQASTSTVGALVGGCLSGAWVVPVGLFTPMKAIIAGSAGIATGVSMGLSLPMVVAGTAAGFCVGERIIN